MLTDRALFKEDRKSKDLKNIEKDRESKDLRTLLSEIFLWTKQYIE